MNCILLKFICWSYNPQHPRMWLYLQTGSLKRELTCNKFMRAKSTMTGAFVRRDQDTQWRKTMCRYSQKTAICKPGKETSEETSPATTSVLDFQTPEWWRQEILVVEACRSVVPGYSSPGRLTQLWWCFILHHLQITVTVNYRLNIVCFCLFAVEHGRCPPGI